MPKPFKTARYLFTGLFLAAISSICYSQPKAGFTISKATGCSPLTVNFTSTTSGGSSPYKYYWRLGNGNTSTNQNANAIYVLAKSYDVTLIVTDASGKIDSLTQKVTVHGNPMAFFSADILQGCPPFFVTYTDKSSGPSTLASWLWDFGDGSTSTTQNPPGHKYTIPGNYSISLNVTDIYGCSSPLVKKDLITVFQPPVADFGAAPRGGCQPPFDVYFTPKVISVGGTRYLWDFGDGDTSSLQSPKHTYMKTGLYTVTLTCTDVNGCTDIKTKTGYIYIGHPVADFKYDPPVGCVPLTVNFTNTTKYGSASGDKYYWDFGDGTTSTAQNPTHTFTSSKSFQVFMKVLTPFGCADSIPKGPIQPADTFTPSFKADTLLCSRPYDDVFVNTSGYNTRVIKWNFGDSSIIGIGEKAAHMFFKKGQYTIKMTVSKDGCVETLTKLKYIRADATITQIGLDKSEGCAPFTIKLKNATLSYDSIISVKWDLGDGTKLSGTDTLTHTYTDTAVDTVRMYIETRHGCKFEHDTIVKHGSLPQADFFSVGDSGCLNMLRHVHFFNTTNRHGPIKADSYTWLFSGHGHVDYVYIPSPDYRYEEPPGDYDVTLIASNKGCANSLTKTKLVHVEPPFAKYQPVLDSCMRNRVTFTDSSVGATHVIYYFDDGDSSTERNPVHVYTQAGLYFPKQVVYDTKNGCSDTFSFYEVPPRIGLLIKEPWRSDIFLSNSRNGCKPYLAKFLAFNNDTGYNYIDFGDGSSIVTQSQDSGKQHIQHWYTKNGSYKVTFRAVNKYGCADTFYINPIVVSGADAMFNVNPVRGCFPLKVTLTDSSSGGPGITKKYAMGNGDTIPVTARVMSYTYKRPALNQSRGDTIRILVSDKTCTTKYSKAVFPIGPTAGFYMLPTPSCDSVNYKFVPYQTGIGPFKYIWNFNNGIVSNDIQPNNTFKIGTYHVLLTVTDTSGCKDSITQLLDVPSTHVKADFYIKITKSTCPPFTAKFIDLSKFSLPGQHSWEWDFGDGSPVSILQNPEKIYYTAGKFNVSLKVKDAYGCKDSIIKAGIIDIKGPKGNYSIDNSRGCPPMLVHFIVKSSDASKIVWDLGDGNLGYGDSLTYMYTTPKRYIPLVIMSDSFGCTYTLPPKDTILVYPPPVPAFNYDSTCAGLPIPFLDKSTAGIGIITSWFWNFGDGGSDTRQNPSHIYRRNGYYPVALKVTNSKGCSATLYRKVRYGNIIAGMNVPTTGCLGSPVQFEDATRSDSTIKSWLWSFGDGSTSTDQNPVHTYMKKGIYSISLYVTNNKGCYDSLINSASIIIGDTMPPPAPVLYRVSVVDDHKVVIDFSQYNDVDFKEYVIYMKNPAGLWMPLDSIKDVNQTSYFAGKLNTLRNVYCFKVQVCNVCGYRSDINSPEHCTIDLSVSPGVNKAMLKWNSYKGWQVKKYQIFRQSVLDPPGFSIIDTVDGQTLKYTDTLVVCYKPMIYRVMAMEKGGNQKYSWSDTSATMPIHIPHVPPAEITRATVQDNKNTLVEWPSIKNGHVKKWLLEKSADGQNFNPIDTGIDHNQYSYTDEKVNVNKNSYSYRLRILDSCDDIGAYSNIGKTILLRVDTGSDVKPHLSWSGYSEWTSGVKYYDIEIKNANGQFSWLARTASGKDTDFSDYITDLNSLPEYTYRVIAHNMGSPANQFRDSTVTSMSNEARLKPRSRLYVPNAFTPNNNGLNDSFFVKGMYIREFHMKIFDRWGTKVFDTNSMKDKWGGDYRKGQPILDAYKYLIYYKGVDGDVKYLNGWVTILE
jgi:gliding motility-associated-like protein